MSCVTPGWAGTISAVPCARTSPATSSWPTKGRANSASRTMAPCGARNTICRRTSSPANSIGFGSRSVRSTCPARLRRWKLREKYGDQVVPANGPIPAHLLGNLWAQEWENIYPLVAPPNADPGYDLTEILKSRNTDALDMVRYGEHFFTSLGFAPLPETFWQRSLFVKPRDRDVVCHASAWDVDFDKRPARQDVHRHHGRILLHHPPRARPQLLPARL